MLNVVHGSQPFQHCEYLKNVFDLQCNIPVYRYMYHAFGIGIPSVIVVSDKQICPAGCSNKKR